MNYLSSSFVGLIAFTCLWSSSWADPLFPEVTGSSIQWPVVSARSINIHRGDGSYVTSLPGNTSSWEAPEPGDYFLVVASEEHWSEWPRSAVVTVVDTVDAGAPMPFVDSFFIVWQSVPAISIEIYRGDGSFVESLPGDSTVWLPDQLGEYFLVATNEGDRQTWPQSKPIEVANPNTVNDSITGLTANTYSQTAAEVFWDRLSGSGIRYQVTMDGEIMGTIDGTSWYYDRFLAGSTSLISVKAIYSDGESSNDRTIAVMTPGAYSVESPIIDRSNFRQILNDAFGIYFGVQYRDQLRHFSTNTVNGMRTESFPATYDCVFGGQAIFTNPFILDFENCDEGNAVYEGALSIHETYGDTDRISSSGITITTNPDSQLYFSGSLDGVRREIPGWYEADGMEISLITPNEHLEVSDSDFNYTIPHLIGISSPLFSINFSGNFVFKSMNTGLQKVSVSTLNRFFHSQLFTESPDWNFSKGILSIVADDGSRLIINADTGDAETVLVQLAYDGVVEQFEQAWDPEWAVWRQIDDL